jgi:ATP-dependent Clp protease protease subunit
MSIARVARKADDDSDEGSVHVDRVTRTVYLTGEIGPEMASKFRRLFAKLERGPRRIVVEINSQGGEQESGLAIMDTIRLSRNTVVTRAAGDAMSMAAIILASGDEREALPHSLVMIHEGHYKTKADYHQYRREVEETERSEVMTSGLLDKFSRKAPGHWAKRAERGNVYLTPTEALKENLIDRVLTRS